MQAAGLVNTLSTESPFTVLAPTDNAFAAALEGLELSAYELLTDTELLTSVLTYHVIRAEVPSAQIVNLDGQAMTTVNGADVSVTVEGDTVIINEATVLVIDVAANNNDVIHVIGTVLLPPS